MIKDTIMKKMIKQKEHLEYHLIQFLSQKRGSEPLAKHTYKTSTNSNIQHQKQYHVLIVYTHMIP